MNPLSGRSSSIALLNIDLAFVLLYLMRMTWRSIMSETRIGSSANPPAMPQPVQPQAAEVSSPRDPGRGDATSASADTAASSRASAREAAHRRVEHGMTGVARQSQFRPAATVADVAGAGRRAGLSATEATHLRDGLNTLPPERRDREIQFLNDHVLHSSHPDRGLRTYADLRQQAERHPDRISDDTIHTLTRAVSERRGGTAAGTEGNMGYDQAVRAGQALTRMPRADFDRVQGMLSRAGQRNGHTVPGADPQLERSLILESVAARYSRIGERNPAEAAMGDGTTRSPRRYIDEVAEYADQIRGRHRGELLQRSTLIDMEGYRSSGGVRQSWDNSCVPTAGQYARAEADPIYAWRAHENPALLREEQAGQLIAYGGQPAPRGRSGGSGIGGEELYSDTLSPQTGEIYESHPVGSTPAERRESMDRMAQALDRGADVPISVRWNDHSGHRFVATDVHQGPNGREFLISDPANGHTRWYSESELVSDQTDFGNTGTGHVNRIFIDPDQ